MQSTYTLEQPQIDGRRWVRETHVDAAGEVHEFTWQAGAGDDVSAVVMARGTALPAQLVTAEIEHNIAAVIADGRFAVVRLRFSTAAQNAAALRAAYKDLTRVEAIMAGDYLSSLSDATLKAIFSMTTLQVTNLRLNKLAPAASMADNIRAAAGA